MAYTIISQNNTTTTLQDENGNIIYVPGRVTLATSTDYTITEVNNNTATLTDGSGKVIRDVPCVVVLAGGGGSSDTHNKGYFATQAALEEAYPTAEAGDYAIVGSTDTVWVWDSDTNAWKDTDTKGQVTSVNGQTGAVVIPNELPSQTGQSGKFLTTDGTNASWSDKPLINKLSGNPTGSVGIETYVYNNNCVAINSDTVLGCDGVTLVGKKAFANSSKHYAVGIGYGARLNAPNAILINASGTNQTNNTANTFKVGNTNGVFEIMSADGTIPTARLTKVNSTITLAAAGWSSNTQTVSVTGVSSTSVVFVAPDPADTTDYVSAGILCTSQGTNSLTFTATTTPSADIDVVVVAM